MSLGRLGQVGLAGKSLVQVSCSRGEFGRVFGFNCGCVLQWLPLGLGVVNLRVTRASRIDHWEKTPTW
jgi:hypothetical protein